MEMEAANTEIANRRSEAKLRVARSWVRYINGKWEIFLAVGVSTPIPRGVRVKKVWVSLFVCPRREYLVNEWQFQLRSFSLYHELYPKFRKTYIASTNFMTLNSFDTHWKHQKARPFLIFSTWDIKKSICMRWVWA